MRDELGRITEKTETALGVTTVTVYGYDAAGRLETVTEDGLLVESYEYDLNGNRTVSFNSAGTFLGTYDDQDRIVAYGDLSFEFGPNGELVEKTDALTNETTSYVYDARGALRGVTLPNGDVIEYLVDGYGRRVGKKRNGVLEKQWVWRGALQPVAELDGAGNVVARFVYAGGVNVPSMMVTASGTFEIVRDHLGSVRYVIDATSGTIAQELLFDPWGRVLVDTSPGLQPFGFAGGLYDAETRLVRFGARDYDAGSGRWTAKDPIRFEGGVNLYEYAGSEPINRYDPRGLDWQDGTDGSGAGPNGPPECDEFCGADSGNSYDNDLLNQALGSIGELLLGLLGGPFGCGGGSDEDCDRFFDQCTTWCDHNTRGANNRCCHSWCSDANLRCYHNKPKPTWGCSGPEPDVTYPVSTL